MPLSHFVRTLASAALSAVPLVLLWIPIGHAQTPQPEPASVQHAKRIVDALEQAKFDDVAKEFNAEVAAAMSPALLGVTWTAFHEQVGLFRSYIDQRVATPRTGLTAVVLGCQYEKAAINIILAFDAEEKIAGLRFTPRPSPSDAIAAQPTSTKFKEESVTIGSGDWALPGTLSMPVGSIKAAVVLVHGSGPNDRDETVGANKPFRDLAWGLADREVAVLRYEKRTRQHAGKMAGLTNLTVREEVTDDVLAAVALLRGHERIDPKRIIVLGHSLGATLAPRIASEEKTLAGIIIMAGITRPFMDVAREQLVYLASLNPNATAAAIDPTKNLERLRAAAPESYWKDLDAYNPAQTAAKLSMPILILQGERDYQVTMPDLQGWRSALGDRANVTIKSYPTLNHLFEPGEGKSTPDEYQRPSHIPDFVLDDIASWIAKLGS